MDALVVCPGSNGRTERMVAAITNPNVPKDVWEDYRWQDITLALTNPAVDFWVWENPSFLMELASSARMDEIFTVGNSIRKRLDGKFYSPKDMEEVERRRMQAASMCRGEFHGMFHLRCIVMSAICKDWGYFVGVPFIPRYWDTLFNVFESRAPDGVKRGRKLQAEIERDLLP